MLKLVIVNCVYPPEPVVSAQMGRDLAEHLAENGAQVTVLCPFPTRPYGMKWSSGSTVSGEWSSDRVEVIRLPSYTAPQSRLLPRMLESWSFGRYVCRYLDQYCSDVDVVYANTWPLLSQALIARYCRKQDIPLVLHIKDTYPESLLNKWSGISREIVSAPLMALDRWTVRKSTQVVVTSENMRRTYLVERGLIPEKIVMVLDWMDESLFMSLPERKDACAKYGIPEENFTFLYLGNIGPVAGVDMLIRAFHAAHLPQAQLVIAGDGSAKAQCETLAKRIGLRNVYFIAPVTVDIVPLIQSMVHVCLLPVRKGAGMSSIPSKLPAYMFSAKPVMATIDDESDTARFVREAQCGWVGEPENVDWLAKKMTEIATMPADVLSEMGVKGREYGLKHFSKSTGVKKLAEVVIGAGGGEQSQGSRK